MKPAVFLKPGEDKSEGQPTLSLAMKPRGTDELCSLCYDRTRRVYAPACKGSVDHEGRSLNRILNIRITWILMPAVGLHLPVIYMKSEPAFSITTHKSLEELRHLLRISVLADKMA